MPNKNWDISDDIPRVISTRFHNRLAGPDSLSCDERLFENFLMEKCFAVITHKDISILVDEKQKKITRLDAAFSENI